MSVQTKKAGMVGTLAQVRDLLLAGCDPVTIAEVTQTPVARVKSERERMAFVRIAHQVDEYTTGQVGILCRCSSRTVAKWCSLPEPDGLKHYRIPGSLDRRVRRQDLVAFLTHHGLPLRGIGRDTAGPIMVVSPDDTLAGGLRAVLPEEQRVRVVTATDGFAVAEQLRTDAPLVALIDFHVGRAEALRLAAHVNASDLGRFVLRVALVGEDEHDRYALKTTGLFCAFFQHPYTNALVEIAKTLTDLTTLRYPREGKQ